MFLKLQFSTADSLGSCQSRVWCSALPFRLLKEAPELLLLASGGNGISPAASEQYLPQVGNAGPSASSNQVRWELSEMPLHLTPIKWLAVQEHLKNSVLWHREDGCDPCPDSAAPAAPTCSQYPKGRVSSLFLGCCLCFCIHLWSWRGRRNLTPKWALLLDSLWSCRKRIRQ